MILVACIDDNNGMLFNNRRQSRDKGLIERIIAMNKRVYVNNFSRELFEGYNNILVDNEFMTNFESEDICFVENIPLSRLINKADKIILYCWNKKYPADTYLDISLGDWNLVSECEFNGTSHDNIKEQIYTKGEI